MPHFMKQTLCLLVPAGLFDGGVVDAAPHLPVLVVKGKMPVASTLY